MKAFRLLVMVCVMMAVGVTMSNAQSKSDNNAKAPNFSFKGADGKTVELRKLEGKVVAINFWATWCGPCRAEIPGFQEVYEKYKSKGLEIVGISLDREGWAKVKPYMEKTKMTYPNVIGDMAVVEAYGGINAIPTTFIVDKKGNIVNKHIGYMDKASFEKIVKGLL